VSLQLGDAVLQNVYCDDYQVMWAAGVAAARSFEQPTLKTAGGTLHSCCSCGISAYGNRGKGD